MDKAIERIIDDNRSKVVTVGNVNDVPNAVNAFGITTSESADNLTNVVNEYPEGTRLALVLTQDELKDVDKSVRVDNGFVSIKVL